MSRPLVKVKADSINPRSAIITIDGKEVPHSSLISVNVKIEHDEVISTVIELFVDELDIVAEQVVEEDGNKTVEIKELQ